MPSAACRSAVIAVLAAMGPAVWSVAAAAAAPPAGPVSTTFSEDAPARPLGFAAGADADAPAISRAVPGEQPLVSEFTARRRIRGTMGTPVLIDMDADGDLDIVAGHRIIPEPAGTIVLFNDGNGRFTTSRLIDGPGSLANSAEFWGDAVFDWTGDGNDDLLVGDWIWPGDGAGGFGAPIEHGLQPRYQETAILVDVDGDGWPERIAPDTDFTMMLAIGAPGGFSRQMKLEFDQPLTSSVVLDVDGDGRRDILCDLAGTRPGFALFRNLGDLMFAPGELVLASDTWVGIVVIDLDEDGFEDIVTLRGFERDMAIIENDPEGDFRAPRLRPLAPTAGSFSSARLRVADVDADEHADLLVLVGTAAVQANQQSTSGLVMVFRGDGAGSLLPPVVATDGMLGFRTRVADVDGRPGAEFVRLGRERNSIASDRHTVLTVDTWRGSRLGDTVDLRAKPVFTSTLTDLDADGRVDSAHMVEGPGGVGPQLVVDFAEPPGGPEIIWSDPRWTGDQASGTHGIVAIRATDFDADGDRDLVVVRRDAIDVIQLAAPSIGRIITTAVPDAAIWLSDSVVTLDVDDDPAEEVIAIESIDGQLRLRIHDIQPDGRVRTTSPDLPFQVIPAVRPGTWRPADRQATALVLAGGTAPGEPQVILVLRRDADGEFGLAASWTIEGSPRAVLPLDFDGDGRMDVLVATDDDRAMQLHPGTPEGFGSPVRIPLAERAGVAGLGVIRPGDGSAPRIVGHFYPRDNSQQNWAGPLVPRGDGSWSFERWYPRPSGEWPLRVVDLDGDGADEIWFQNRALGVSVHFIEATTADGAFDLDRDGRVGWSDVVELVRRWGDRADVMNELGELIEAWGRASP